MKRTNIYLTPKQHEWLAKKADATGLKVSDHIRRAIELYMEQDGESEKMNKKTVATVKIDKVQYTFLQNRYGARYSADELMRRAMLEIVAMQANSESVEAEQAMRAEKRRQAMSHQWLPSASDREMDAGEGEGG